MQEKNDKPIKRVLQEMVSHYKLKSKLNQVRINALWSELMGPSISKYTKDILIRRRKLYITIDSSPLKQELSYAKEKIKDLINAELGEEYILEVIIR